MPKSPARRRVGRPPVEITPQQVLEAARYGLDHSQVAAILGCSLKTLQRRMERAEFRDAYETGHELAKHDIKQWLFGAAKNGNVKAMMFLANNLIGWSEKNNTTLEQNVNYVVEI